MQGKIIKLISDDFTVISENQIHVCKCRGVFRSKKIKPLVGDIVKFDENNIIYEVMNRKNELVRPPISNIDFACIITSAKDPDFSANLLDKLVNIINYNNIEPIIIFTKMDLLDEDKVKDIQKYIEYYSSIGYKVYKNDQIEDIKKIFKNKIGVFTGQTGAGKSTLLNSLNPSLNLKTNEISYALGRGKHTTRHVELISMYGGYIADTPGFSDVDFIDMTKVDVRDNFVEFENYKENCKYRDCMHDKEDECEIKRQVSLGNILNSRYENYINFIGGINDSFIHTKRK